jgi:hypothetical protein
MVQPFFCASQDLRRESRRETPLHPDCTGGPVEAINGPNAKVTYAVGSLEWQQQEKSDA